MKISIIPPRITQNHPEVTSASGDLNWGIKRRIAVFIMGLVLLTWDQILSRYDSLRIEVSRQRRAVSKTISISITMYEQSVSAIKDLYR